MDAFQADDISEETPFLFSIFSTRRIWQHVAAVRYWLPLSARVFWRVMYRVLIISKFPWDGTEKCRRPDRCVKFASFDWKVITATRFFATQFPLIWFQFQLMYWLVGVSKFFFLFRDRKVMMLFYLVIFSHSYMRIYAFSLPDLSTLGWHSGYLSLKF